MIFSRISLPQLSSMTYIQGYPRKNNFTPYQSNKGAAEDVANGVTIETDTKNIFLWENSHFVENELN